MKYTKASSATLQSTPSPPIMIQYDAASTIAVNNTQSLTINAMKFSNKNKQRENLAVLWFGP